MAKVLYTAEAHVGGGFMLRVTRDVTLSEVTDADAANGHAV
ncbi:MAG TPA: hypothetical protein VFC57_08920 [Aeromicrobium sp.]|nr:hypothetical protein [Aeromicrobium sp.]